MVEYFDFYFEITMSYLSQYPKQNNNLVIARNVFINQMATSIYKDMTTQYCIDKNS